MSISDRQQFFAQGPQSTAPATQWLYPRVVVFCTTAGVLLLQLTQTRLFSVAFWHHLVYLIISVALLGFGISGTWLSVRQGGWLARHMRGGSAAAGFVTSALISSLLVPRLGIALSTLFADPAHVTRLVVTYVAAVFPYFFAGWILCTTYRDHPSDIHGLYFADMSGAGSGCLLYLGLIHAFGAVNLVVLACCLVGFPALLCTNRGRGRALGSVAAVAAVLLALALFLAPIEQGIPLEPTKGFNRNYVSLTHGDEKVVEHSEWNAISRVDVVSTLFFPNRKVIYIDGDAWTPIMTSEFPRGPHAFDWEPLHAGQTPYLLGRPFSSVLVIGSGGGVDVLNALRAKASHVEAVEINPSITRLVRGMYDNALQGLFRNPAVSLANEDGRSYVRRSTRRYDAIVLNAVDTFAALSSGAYMLSENYLYTVDAMTDYLDHLTNGGVLCITRWDHPAEGPRLFALVLEALYQMGVPEPRKHILARSDHNYFTAVLASKEPFTEQEIGQLVTYHRRSPHGFLYYPESQLIRRHPYGDTMSLYAQARANGTHRGFLDAYEYNIQPVWDDSPFFFNYGKPSRLVKVLDSQDATECARGHWGMFTLFSLSGAALTALLVFMLVPLWGVGSAVSLSWRWLVFFICLGSSFIFLEIGLLHQFALLLGHPSRSLALVLSSLLLAAGMGARFGPRFSLRTILGLVVLTVLSAGWIYPFIIRATLGFWLPVRAAIAVVLVALPGFLVGVPMPRALRLVSEFRRDAVPWMLAVNSGATVLGSLLAMLLAILLNFKAVFLCAGLGYAIAAIACVRRSNQASGG